MTNDPRDVVLRVFQSLNDHDLERYGELCTDDVDYDLHGLDHHNEAVLQLRQAAGARQVPDARRALGTPGAGSLGGALVYGAGDP